MKIFDYKCKTCGNIIKDHLLKNDTDPDPICPMCDNIMEKMFTGFRTKTNTRSHRSLPKNYNFSQGGVNFDRNTD